MFPGLGSLSAYLSAYLNGGGGFGKFRPAGMPDWLPWPGPPGWSRRVSELMACGLGTWTKRRLRISKRKRSK